MYIISEH